MTTQTVGHTPGPWKLLDGRSTTDGRYQLVLTETGGLATTLAVVEETPAKFGEFTANARLVAAAPDLLAACKLALEVIDTGAPTHTTDGPTGEALRAAVAKAQA